MMSIFKNDRETKRMIFNVYADLADRIDHARERSKSFDKRLDVDTCINKALEKFLHKAEKKLEELEREHRDKSPRLAARPDPNASAPDNDDSSEPTA
jgi:hypothetical protein